MESSRPQDATGRSRVALAVGRLLFGTQRRLLVTVALALAAPILLAFLILERPMAVWSEALLEGRRSADAIAVGCASLLAADIILPIPSSIVATVAARLLDPGRALAAIAGGSAASAAIGWLLGRLLRGAALARIADPATLARADASFARWGLWAFAATRAVPLFAEEFAILAGVHRVPFWRTFLPLTLAACVPLAVFYVVALRVASLAIGDEPPVWVLFLVASVLPVLAMAIARLGTRRRAATAE